MKSSYLRQHGKSGVELVEESFSALRRASPVAFAWYYLGSVPFVGGLLLFWNSMSRARYAAEDLALASLGLALVFLWMKVCHAQFTRVLLAEWSGTSAPFSLGRFFQTFLTQASLQASALFLLPFASLALLPFPWVYAFYQHATALDHGEGDLAGLIRQSLRQCRLWPGQNAILQLILGGFAFYVFLNCLTLVFVFPALLKNVFGLETMASMNPFSLLNTTLLASVTALAFLCTDPLLKAAYALRSFYGNSIETGADLQAELRLLARRPLALVAAGLFLFLGTGRLDAQPATPAPQPVDSAVVSPTQLDRKISEVLEQNKYLWRPRQEVEAAPEKKSFLTSTLEQIRKFFRDAMRALGDVLRKIWDFLFPPKKHHDSGNGSWWVASERGLLILALVAAGGALSYLVFRLIKARRKPVLSAQGIPVAPAVNIEDENLAPDELPEDRWTTLGREFMSRGELRHALRAFYLASLAHLASASLVTIARGKSNREYLREVRRRGHAVPEVPELFGANVHAFDRAWYGLHEVTPEIVEVFLTNLTRLKSLA